MRLPGFVLALFVCLTTHGMSPILFATGGGTFNGAPGNMVFNGEHFITPTVQANGAIHLTFLDTNGVAVSNIALSITGNTPRLVRDGADYLLAWVNTNGASVLTAARIVGGVIGSVSLIETNVADETVSLSAAAGQVLALWQSAGSNSSVFARRLAFSGAPAGNTFAISPSARPQRYPSVDNDGTNHLVCWMEQNVTSNDWRAVAGRLTSGGGLSGSPVQVSQTNSMRPYATACSFGTNFLVAWSADEGPWAIETNYCCFGGASNLWRPTIHARMVSESAVPLGSEFSMLRNAHYSTNVAVSFGNGRYLVTCYTWGLWYKGYYVQPLDADGSRREYPFTALHSYYEFRPRLGFGASRFCAAWSDQVGAYTSVIAPGTVPDFQISNVRRTNDTIAVTLSPPGYSQIEVSTNLIHWEKRTLADLPSLGGRPRLFVRKGWFQWNCIENLRLIEWAKQNWEFNNFKNPSTTPNAADLFSPEFPQPVCPDGGTYTLNSLDTKPNCTIAGHSN